MNQIIAYILIYANSPGGFLPDDIFLCPFFVLLTRPRPFPQKGARHETDPPLPRTPPSPRGCLYYSHGYPSNVASCCRGPPNGSLGRPSPLGSRRDQRSVDRFCRVCLRRPRHRPVTPGRGGPLHSRRDLLSRHALPFRF